MKDDIDRMKELRAEQDAKFAKTRGGKVCAVHPDWSHEICETVAQQQVQIGMTEEQVKASWGKPQQINTTTSAGYEVEQWAYGSGEYLYFQHGQLESMQTSR